MSTLAVTLAVNQPTYLPWLGYFDLIRRADTFVIYDHVLFSKQSWQQRNRIRGSAGPQLLTVPVLHGKGGQQRIVDVEIDGSHHFQRKHLTAIRASYGRTPGFAHIFPQLEEIYGRNHGRLVDLNLDLISFGLRQLDIKTKLLRSSALSVDGTKVDALIHLCKQLGATRYLSPDGASEYIEQNNLFARHGIVLEYQRFQHPVYPQRNNGEFMSHLSFIDYLFNAPDGMVAPADGGTTHSK